MNIPRYKPVANDKFGIADDADGKLCEYRHYARLNAEVERLQKEVWRMSEDIVGQIKDIKGRTWQEAFYIQTKAFLEKNSEHLKEIARLKAEVERLTAFTTRTIIPNEELQAQVERLTKAGDAMSDQLLCDYGDNPLTYAWNAAKEGKQ